MGSTLRITHVLANAEFAGTERYVVNVSHELVRRGHDVAAIGGAPDRMPALLGEIPWSPGPDARHALGALLSGGPRDVVHSHMTKADFCALAASPVTHAKRVSTRHIVAARGFSRTARRLAPVVRRSLSCELAVSRFVSDALERPADVVLLNGVPRLEMAAGPRRRSVLIAHRLAPEKQTETALRGFALSGLAAQGWRFVVAGSGGEHAALRRLADDLGIADSTDWLGWVDDTTSLYLSEGVLAAPAPGEPCSLTILEAMAAGMPIVASASGGNLETMGQLPTAAFHPPGDAQAMADQLVRLAADDAARAAYGAGLRALQRQRLTLEIHVDGLEAVYAAVTGGRRPRSAGAAVSG
jgi:glycosyltransferase involved in cell wall biosynthesis